MNITLIAAVLLAALAWLWLRRQYQTRGRAHWVFLVLFALSVATVLLAALGKLHWVGAVLASAATVLFSAGRVLVRWLLPRIGWLPFLQRYWQQQGDPGRPAGGARGEKMDRREALAVLGLDDAASRDDIIQAHRRLMQKNHPDRGGSAHLASRINAAKDLLLGD